MIILASDTSTKSLSVAIYNDNCAFDDSANYHADEIYGKASVEKFSHFIDSITLQTGTTHSQTHMPAIIEMLKKNNLKFQDIDIFACTIGPGSYTGIRIGVSSTKAMAYAAQKAAVGVSTLECLAFPLVQKDAFVCPILDARNRRVFSAVYSSQGLVLKEANRTIDEFIENIRQYFELHFGKGESPMNILFCGDASQIYEKDPIVIEQMNKLQADGFIKSVSFINSDPDAGSLAILAAMKYDHAISDPFKLSPNYLSPSSAERMKKKKIN